jgi:hypothetical protein
MHAPYRFGGFLVSGTITLSCTSAPVPAPDSPERPTTVEAETARGPSQPGLSLPPGTVGPFLAPAPGGWVTVWASPEGQDLAWNQASFDSKGVATTAPQRLALAEPGLDLVKLHTFDTQRGLVLSSFTEETDDDDEPTFGLQSFAIALTGGLVSAPGALVAKRRRVIWTEVAPLPNGALVSWAEDVGDRAEVYSIVVNLNGHRQTSITRLHTQARAWQLAAHPKGAMLGVVTLDGNVEVVTIDNQGVASSPLSISDNHSAEPDIDVSVLGANLLVAFSDRRVLEPHLFSSVVSGDGQLRSEPRLMALPNGAQALLGLKSGSLGTFAYWQDLTQSPGEFRLAKVNAEGRIQQPTLALPLPDVETRAGLNTVRSLPEVVLNDAFTAVYLPSCVKGATSCVPNEHPDLVNLDGNLTVSSTHTWFRDTRPDLVWDFQCARENCAALTAYYTSPTRVRLVTAGNTSTNTGAAPAFAPQPLPRLSVQAIVHTPQLAAINAVKGGQGTLLAWLSEFDPNIPYQVPSKPAPDGRYAPVQAQLKTRWLAEDGEPRRAACDATTEQSISIRARSVAGLDVANTRDRNLLVWTAIDNKQPQVFTTLLDGRGQRLKQSMLTRQNGEVLSVSAQAFQDTWFVGWIREEGARTAPYVARLGATLGRMSPDVLIPVGKESISGLELAATAQGPWVAMAGTVGEREVIRLINLDPVTLQVRKSANDPLSSSPRAEADQWQQFAPRLTSWKEGLLLAWLERKNDQTRVRALQLDASANVLAAYQSEPAERLTALSIDCAELCRVVATNEHTDETGAGYLALSTIRSATRANAPVQNLELLQGPNLSSPSALQVPPAIIGGLVYYPDVSAEEVPQLLELRWLE